MTKRLFIALNLPAEAKNELENDIIELQAADIHSTVKWVSRANLHLTLQFLGEVPEEMIGGITKIMAEVFSGVEALEFQFGLIGGFPNLKNPQIVYRELLELSGQLQFLQKDLGEKLSQSSLVVDSRPFQAHLTLGRASGSYFLPKNLPISNLAAFTINSVELMSSELSAAGPEYTVVNSLKF